MKKSAPSRRSSPPRQGGSRRSDSSASRQATGPSKSQRLVAGVHAIREVMSVRPKAIDELWLRQGWETSSDLRATEELARRHRLKIEVKPASAMDKFYANHQGAIVLTAERPRLDFDGLAKFETSSLLLLDGLEDPHNLGAIVRTAWLTGVHGILIPEDRAVGLTPTVHKVACGGLEHVPVESQVNFTPAVEKLKEQGYWVFGLSHKAERTVFEMKLPEKIIWAIGAEDKGLRGTTERLCDELVSIPQVDAAASYNASVATAMALTETLRQRQFPSSPE